MLSTPFLDLVAKMSLYITVYLHVTSKCFASIFIFQVRIVKCWKCLTNISVSRTKLLQLG